MPLLILFGDSICWGYGAQPGESWAERVHQALQDSGLPVRMQNAGVNGNTTEDALRRMRGDVEQHRPQAIYIQFGLNDASWWTEDDPAVGRETYIANMREIVRRAFACGCRLVFVATNHPVIDAFGMKGYARMVASYNEALRETFIPGQDEGGELVFVDLERGILGEADLDSSDLLAMDGVHLSQRGNAWYADKLGEIFRIRLADLAHETGEGKP